jgi:hypothetical protein
MTPTMESWRRGRRAPEPQAQQEPSDRHLVFGPGGGGGGRQGAVARHDLVHLRDPMLVGS